MMPIFEYACTRCGHKKEVICSVSGGVRPGDTICPQCGNDGMRRVPSVPGPPRGGDTEVFYPKGGKG